MISGTADDRLAFVIETDAKLDAIKAARAEVTGLAADTERSGVASIAATRSMSAWSALQAEATGKVGEHSLAIGRLGYRLESLTSQAVGANSAVGLLGASFLKFGVGDIYTVAILGGIYAVVEAYDFFTEGSRKAREEADKFTDSLVAQARRAHEATLSGLADLKLIAETNAQAVGRESGIGIRSMLLSIISGRPTISPEDAAAEATRLADAQTAVEQATKNYTDAWDKAEKDRTRTQTEEDRKREAAAQHQLEVQLREANRLGDAAVRNLNTVLDNNERAVAQISEERLKTLQTNASHQPLTSPAGALSELAAIQAQRAQEQEQLDHSKITNDLKLQLEQAYDDEEYAKVAELNRQIEEENDRHNKTVAHADAEAAKQRKEAIQREASLIASVEKKMSADLLDTRLSFGKRLLKAALEPEIAFLEAKAMSQFEQSAADFLTGDFGGGAAHAAAGLALETGAGLVGQIAGSGHSGSSGGGSASSSSGTFEPRSATEGGAGVTINLYTNDPYSPQQIQQLTYNLNRAGVLKIPVPISPTTGLRPAA